MRAEPKPWMTESVNKRNQRNYARGLIFTHGKKIIQRMAAGNLATISSGLNTLQFNQILVGFLCGFIVEVTGTITNTGSGALTRTPNGSDNLVSNVQFNDFTGNPRHNCSGRAYSFIESCKWHHMPGASYTSDTTNGYAGAVGSNICPATIANGGNASVSHVFHIPCMENNEMAMAGGLYLGVNNQNTLLKISLNPNAVVAGAGAADPLTAVYTGTSGTFTNATVTVYQEYWIDMPKYKGTDKYILPVEDLETSYMITELNSGMALSANAMTYWTLPTFSELLGFYWSYDNNNVLNPATDWSRAGVYVSNFATVREYDPNTLDRVTRDQCHSSFPQGSYGFFWRQHPLNVDVYPSLQFGFQPTSVGGSAAYVDVTLEMFRPVQYMQSASGVGGA